jgi:hypothetical protein
MVLGNAKGVLLEVLDERLRQDAHWGERDHFDGTTSAFKASAEAAKRATDRFAKAGRVRWRHILDEEVQEAFAEIDPVKLRAELLQVAAVAVAWIECIDRRQGGER